MNNKRSIVGGTMEKLKHKKHPARDKNCVIELSQLKKEVDNEIRRDRKLGRLEIAPMSAISANK